MRRAYEQMVVVGLLWGTIGPAVAFLDEHTAMTSVQISLWRVAIAIGPLTVVALVLARRAAPPGVVGERRSDGPGGGTAGLSAGLTGYALLVGVITAGYQLAYFAAVSAIGVTVPTLIALGLGPILVAVGETVLFARRPSRRTLGALGVALTGLVLLALGGSATVTVGGVALSLASAAGYAAAVLSAGPLGRRIDVATLNAITVAGGLAVLLPLALITGGAGGPGNAGGLVALLHLGLVVSGLAYALYYAAARTLPSTHVVVLALLEPVTAPVLAALLLGETLTAGAIAGGGLMLGAVVALRDAEPEPMRV